MELKLLNEQGQASATLQASDALFGREYNEALIHQVVVITGQRPLWQSCPEGS